MSHTIHDKDKLLARIRRLKGQMEAVERSLENGKSCGEILQLLASVRGALSGLTNEVLLQHLHEHVVKAENEEVRMKAADELAQVLKTYLR